MKTYRVELVRSSYLEADMEKTMNKFAAEGWEVKAVNLDSKRDEVYITFEREKA